MQTELSFGPFDLGNACRIVINGGGIVRSRYHGIAFGSRFCVLIRDSGAEGIDGARIEKRNADRHKDKAAESFYQPGRAFRVAERIPIIFFSTNLGSGVKNLRCYVTPFSPKEKKKPRAQFKKFRAGKSFAATGTS